MRLSLNRLVFSLPPAIKISVTLCVNAFSRCSTAQKHEGCPEYFLNSVQKYFHRSNCSSSDEGLSNITIFVTVAKIGCQGKIIQHAQGKCVKSVH